MGLSKGGRPLAEILKISGLTLVIAGCLGSFIKVRNKDWRQKTM